MSRQFDDNLYQFDQAQPSYWHATSMSMCVCLRRVISAGECRERFYDSSEQYGALLSRPADLRFGIFISRQLDRFG